MYGGDGGAASSASLYWPSGVGLDSVGNIYIADTYNYRIRKVTVSTGIITTIAGTGTSSYSGDGGAATSATFKNPMGVAIDSSGRRLYLFIEWCSYSLLAGNVYISDWGSHCIRKITMLSDSPRYIIIIILQFFLISYTYDPSLVRHPLKLQLIRQQSHLRIHQQSPLALILRRHLSRPIFQQQFHQ